MKSAPAPRPACEGAGQLRRLAARLRAGGYTLETLRQRLQTIFPDDVGLLNHAPALQRLAGDRSAAATLMRLFFLEAEETVRHVAGALSRRACDDLLAAGLLERRGDTLRTRLRIDAVGTQYFLTDRRFHALAQRRVLRLPVGDPVYSPSSDSLMLRDAIPHFDRARVLDLCTGSGVQALQQAERAERVVAVDINPRAVATARLNAQLNGVENVDVRCGNLYAPVRSEQFDLIIANPPFVASPYTDAPSYHSGGPTGARVLRRIISGLAQHLSADGRAFAISHLALRPAQTVHTVTAPWFHDFPGRALVLILETGTPIDLAAAQSLFALRRGLASYAEEVKRWVDYLKQQRIVTVALLLIVAECGNQRGVTVVEAQPRVLPIPLTPPPAERIASWLALRPLESP